MKTLIALLLTCVSLSAQNLDWFANGNTEVPFSATVSSDGTTLTIVWFEAKTRGVSYSGSELSLTGVTSGGPFNGTYSSGDGTTTWVLTGFSTIYSGDTVTLDFTGGANVIINGSSQSMPAFSGVSVVNNSTQSAYLVAENFEETGTPTANTWTTVAGSPNYDSAAAGTSPNGGQYLQIPATSGGEVYVSISPVGTTVEIYCQFRFDNSASSTRISIFGVRDSSGNALATFRLVPSTGVISVYANGADSSDSVSTMSINTWYHCWLRFQASGTCTAAFSTDGTRPTSGNAFVSKTGGAGTPARGDFRFAGNNGFYDRVVISESTIGNNP